VAGPLVVTGHSKWEASAAQPSASVGRSDQ